MEECSQTQMKRLIKTKASPDDQNNKVCHGRTTTHTLGSHLDCERRVMTSSLCAALVVMVNNAIRVVRF